LYGSGQFDKSAASVRPSTSFSADTDILYSPILQRCWSNTIGRCLLCQTFLALSCIMWSSRTRTTFYIVVIWSSRAKSLCQVTLTDACLHSLTGGCQIVFRSANLFYVFMRMYDNLVFEI